MGRVLDELYYLIGYRTQGLPQAEAEVAASARAIDATTKQIESGFGEIVAKAKHTGVEANAAMVDGFSRLSEQDIKAAAAKYDKLFGDIGKKSGATLARELSSSVRETFASGKLSIQELLNDKLITSSESKERIRALSVQFNQDLQTLINESSAAGKFAGKEGAEAFTALVSQFKNVDEEAQVAGGSIAGLRRPLTSLADQVLGVNRPLGQMSSALGAFAIGTAATVGILAGIAAIGFMYERLTAQSKAAQEQIDKTIESLLREADVRTRSDQSRADEALKQAQQNANDRREQLNNRHPQSFQDTGGLSFSPKAVFLGIKDWITGTNAVKNYTDAQIALTQAKIDDNEVSGKMAASYAQHLGDLARAGTASKDELQQLKVLADAARSELAAFSSDSSSGAIARAKYAVEHPGEPNSVAEHQMDLKGIVNAYDDYIKQIDKANEKDAHRAEVLRQQQQAFRDSLAAQLAALTPGAGEAKLDARIQRMTDQAARIHFPIDELNKFLAAYRALSTVQANDEVKKKIIELSRGEADAVERVRDEYDQLIQTYRDKGASQEYLDQLAHLRDRAVEVAAALSKADQVIRHTQEAGATGFSGNRLAQMGQLLDARDALQKAQDGVVQGSKEWEQYEQRILQIDREIKALQDATGKSMSDADKERLKRIREISTDQAEFNQIMGAITNIASQFGTIDYHTASILKGIQDWGNAAAAFAKGDIVTGTIDAIEGAVSIGKGLFSHQKSQTQIQGEKIVSENTQALIANTNELRLGRVTATGKQTEDFLKAIGTSDITGETKHNRQAQTDRLEQNLNKMGYTMDQFRAFAQQYNIKLSPAIGGTEIQQLLTAIQQGSPTKFAGSYAGQMQELNDSLQIYNITDAAKQFSSFVKSINSITGGGGLLGKTLQQFDITTADGIAKAQAAIQKLFTQMQQGAISQTDLAGLGPQDFLDALLKAQGYLTTLAGSHGPNGTGGYNVDRTITETSASRLAAFAESSNAFLEQIAGDVRALVTNLGIVRPLTLSAPATAAGVAAGTITINMPITIEGSGLTSVPQAEDLGQRIGQRAFAEMSQRLMGAARVVAANTGNSQVGV